MIGVNCWTDDAKALKDFMRRENLPWRTFVAKGAIAEQWNNPPTPTFYVLDHEGVIQRKWTGNPGPETMEKVLDDLIQLVEEKGLFD